MRLTGLAQNVATFQCISALSGTGFTTSESGMIVNYPVRRRILIVLMLFGNLGLVSCSRHSPCPLSTQRRRPRRS